MINSSVYNYINVLDKAADAAWLRNEAITNNIANADTPGYKRQDISFEGELKKAMKVSRYESVDAKVADLKSRDLQARTYTDYDSVSYRLDGNNVDIQTENVTLVKNQLKYNGLVQSANQEFSNLKMVMK
ncbi:MAG: flagellar basal body rod protein FlgB [Lachnospiraceae bacterium]|nr:flagellar basal body rod protein FlgB [Lachnospiraceae bacterium]MDD3659385.1 flagellar basal body rod protein FlgB [Lachnospiraceae bacterium]